jgi:DNA helicase-2/ATP-dependent DNA helicase PcrA
MKHILNTLNTNQLEAVEHINGSLVVLAVAGSGKTKTITTRLAYIINKHNIDPQNTLTLTFTNKAASQMRKSALKLIDDYKSIPLLCTFHKFGLLFLKKYITKLNRAKDFIIIDSDDKYKLIKSIAKKMRIDIDIHFVSNEISKYKNSLFLPEEAVRRAELKEYKQTALIYVEYQKIITKDNLVDFDDLLLLPYLILSNNQDLKEEISNKYRYIMVDEYQDTNELQLKLLECLLSQHNNLCVVGDDDQSIYSWRGANVQNILEFNQTFTGARTIKLEINYRSTQQIINVANSLIEHNSSRLTKTMSSHKGNGASVKLESYIDEMHEAKSVAKEIQKLIKQGVKAQNIAVLYRVHALSRSIEDAFTKESLHFKLIGGMPFYERAEVKDIISYLRALSNPCDDFSFMRIINKPKRGIGKATIEKLKNEANRQNLSIYKSIENLSIEELNNLVGKKVSGSLVELIKNIKLLKNYSQKSLNGFIDLFEDKINLKSLYENLTDGLDRVSNINEFYGYFNEQVDSNPDIKLEDLLNNLALGSEQDRDPDNIIPIMSIHASKGLEFDYVFLIGLEEGFFPLLGESCNIEEERRLGYVAITRAKEHLSISYVDSRFYRGKRKVMEKSRFLGEAGLIKSASLKHTKSSPYKKGDLVKHKIFGMGRVQAVNKAGKDYNLLINFSGEKKNILSSFVKPI